jgi:hypothetical protein
LESKLHIVWGNNDGDKNLLTKKFQEIDALLHRDFMNIVIENRKIAMIYGTDEAIVKALVKCGDYELLLRGHTNKPEILRERKTLLINPGTPLGYLNKEKTIAIVDLNEMEFQIIKL